MARGPARSIRSPVASMRRTSDFGVLGHGEWPGDGEHAVCDLPEARSRRAGVRDVELPLARLASAGIIGEAMRP